MVSNALFITFSADCETNFANLDGRLLVSWLLLPVDEDEDDDDESFRNCAGVLGVLRHGC
jgi:hypothetical protein